MSEEEGEVPESPIRSTFPTSKTTFISEFNILQKLGEGTFGSVTKATDKTGTAVALKKLLTLKQEDGLSLPAIREIRILKRFKHENIVNLLDIAVERGTLNERGSVFLVFQLMDHDLAGLLRNPSVELTAADIKSLMKQLLKGIEFLHKNDIIHRDIKAANILISNDGTLKLADFGLARIYSEEMTTCVVTLWYRPPELLLADANSRTTVYTSKADMWGIGLIFGEMWLRRPLLPGKSELEQIELIFELVGSPTLKNWPEHKELYYFKNVVTFMEERNGKLNEMFDKDDYGVYHTNQSNCYYLLYDLLRLNPQKRISASKALDSDWFYDKPSPTRIGEFPLFSPSFELDFRNPNQNLTPFKERQGKRQRVPTNRSNKKFKSP